MKTMKKQLIELLNIKAHSGEEKAVRKYLQPILMNLMDEVTIDHYGNLLGVKTCGDGKGATILLSSHMDVVRAVEKDSKIIEENGVICADKGACGGDDKCGITIILTVLRNLSSIKFNGKIKVAFTREEEIGCVGSSKMSPKFYDDVDLAIVVDRRGNRDIVVGCVSPFCSNEVAEFLEDCGGILEKGWKAVSGGISDACTFSEQGINSVNLSCGFYNEHTKNEYIKLADMVDTTNLILQALALVNNFFLGFGNVPTSNKWVSGYKYTNNKYYNYGVYGTWTDDETQLEENGFIHDVGYIEAKDTYGEIYVTELGKNIIAIGQGKDEVLISRDLFKKISEVVLNENTKFNRI